MQSVHLSLFCLGRTMRAYKNIAAFQNSSCDTIDIGKFFQGCGHIVHGGSIYYNIAGTFKIAKYVLSFHFLPIWSRKPFL